MVKIRIKPKIVDASSLEMIQRERQQECCDEIRNLRCELEMMKTAMDEMRQHMNEMRLQLQSGCEDINVKPGYAQAHAHAHTHENSASDFGDWVNGLEVTSHDLETMFESKEIVDWASKFIVADLKQRSGHPYPLCAIKGSRNELLMYDKDAWKKMTDQEFASTIMNKMFKKLLAAFTAWKNENYNKILSSEHFSTLYHSNYARILSFNENVSKLKMKLFHALLLCK
jgi:hypothetical protein